MGEDLKTRLQRIIKMPLRAKSQMFTEELDHSQKVQTNKQDISQNHSHTRVNTKVLIKLKFTVIKTT